jgi:transcriptional regulator with XRE-family HTH domain
MDSLKKWLDANPERTQTALAQQLNVSAPTVNDWVHGESSPATSRLHGIHEATGIQIAILLADCATDARRRKRSKAAA